MTPNGIPSYRPSVSGTTHMVSSGHYLAAAAGYRILEQGGNAIDAGVASGITINVTLPHMTSFAGVAPIVIYLAETRQVVTISGLGRWPHSVSLEYFQDTFGEIPPGYPRSVVPAACDAWLTALEQYGTMTFEQVVTPALELAEGGFPISWRLSNAISQAQSRIAEWPTSRAVFMPHGTPLKVGDQLGRGGLAGIFHNMIDIERAKSGAGRQAAIRAARDYFYKGEIAEQMVRFCQQHGGFLTMEDFTSFQVKAEPPEVGSYKEYQVYTCGPWCQGPSLIQTLAILEGLDLSQMGHNSPDYVHSVVEATKLAFADREAYYGDPEFVDVPMDALLSKGYAAERRAMIDQATAWPQMPPPGDPAGVLERTGDGHPTGTPVAKPGQWEHDTSYTCVVDRWGNAFSGTPSDGDLGAPLVPGLDVTVSGRGSQSWLEPDHPSSLAPWKRPRLTPNPALALKDGELFIPFVTPGGDAQVQAMAQTFLNIVELGMDPQQAIEAPRAVSMSFPNSFWPHTYLPGRLAVEGRLPKAVIGELEKRGHEIEVWDDWTAAAGGMCAIMVNREQGILMAGADPRRESYAIGR